MTLNYETIKALAAENGLRVDELIALAPANDPFYIGRPSDWVMGRWFEELWRRFGYRTGIHLRRVHYQVISQSPVVLLPNRWNFYVSNAVYEEAKDGGAEEAEDNGAPELLIPAGAIRVPDGFTWRGPREKDGKMVAGESIRFLHGPNLPPQVRPEQTYYVREVGEVKAGGPKIKYILISARPLDRPIRLTPGHTGTIGEPYENTERCWDYLTQAGKVARYLGLVRMDAFVDRRNPEPRIFASEWEPTPGVSVYDQSWDTPRLPAAPELPGYSVQGYDPIQSHHLEIWCEKSTMNDVIVPLCEQYEVNFVTGLGEMSLTSTLQVMRRILARGRPARILYISDYDPAGQSMPVAVSRKIEHLARTEFEGEDLDIRVYPIVMTASQVQEYRLPRTPIKETERRAAAFEARHGEGAVELDALEALFPGELSRIIETFILQFYDRSLDRRVEREKRRLIYDLERLQAVAYARHQEAIDKLAQDYEDIARQVAALLSPWVDRQKALWEQISEELEAADYEGVFADHPLPVAVDAPGDTDLVPLYYNEREYIEQLRFYKEHQRKTAVEVEE